MHLLKLIIQYFNFCFYFFQCGTIQKHRCVPIVYSFVRRKRLLHICNHTFPKNLHYSFAVPILQTGTADSLYPSFRLALLIRSAHSRASLARSRAFALSVLGYSKLSASRHFEYPSAWHCSMLSCKLYHNSYYMRGFKKYSFLNFCKEL